MSLHFPALRIRAQQSQKLPQGFILTSWGALLCCPLCWDPTHMQWIKTKCQPEIVAQGCRLSELPLLILSSAHHLLWPKLPQQGAL